MSRGALNGEESISRLLTSGEALSAAMRGMARGTEAVAEDAGRMKLQSLNAALEAQRSDEQAVARIAGEIGRRAEETASRARALMVHVREAEEIGESVNQAAREAGRVVHDGATAARQAAREAAGAWEGAETLISRLEAADVSAGQLHERAACVDQERSAVEGIARIVARIASLGKRMAGIAEGVAADRSEAERNDPRS